MTAPGLSWQAQFKHTKANLELLSDLEMHMFFEKGNRGGISTIVTKRYVKANNKYCKDYNPDKPENHIMYLDANSLYSYAMCYKLPIGGFVWLPNEETDDTDKMRKRIMDTDFNSEKDCLYEVDLLYPEHLHDSHNDYPLAPETMTIPEEMYSDYQKKLFKDLNKKVLLNTKLVPNLMDKKNYIVHGQTLKLYLELGMELVKVHKALEFKQEAWLKPYIEHNIDLRQKSKSDFEKNFFKLMNNAVFGKTMENLRKRIRVDIVDSRQHRKLRKLVASPLYIEHRIYEGLIAVHSVKRVLKLNRPVYAGQAVLDLSKHVMYSFWYRVLKPKYGDDIELIYTDTDSLIFNVKNVDFYKEIEAAKDMYDLSGYPKDHFCYDGKNGKVSGKFKDEASGRPITEVAAISSKMYSYTMEPLPTDLAAIAEYEQRERDNIQQPKGLKLYLRTRQRKLRVCRGQSLRSA